MKEWVWSLSTHKIRQMLISRNWISYGTKQRIKTTQFGWFFRVDKQYSGRILSLRGLLCMRRTTCLVNDKKQIIVCILAAFVCLVLIYVWNKFYIIPHDRELEKLYAPSSHVVSSVPEKWVNLLQYVASFLFYFVLLCWRSRRLWVFVIQILVVEMQEGVSPMIGKSVVCIFLFWVLFSVFVPWPYS